MQAKNERFEMRLDETIIDNLDAWRVQQSDAPSRAEAVRRLIDEGLGRSDQRLRLSDGERLNILMLCDLYKHLKVKGDIDADFVASAILDGELWALRWRYPGIFHGDDSNEQDVSTVVHVLDMWSFLEESYQKLSKKDRERIKGENLPFGSHVEFLGFDGNNETTYLGIARFLVEKMDRFTRFKGRDMNSHMPVLGSYRAMSAVFETMRAKLVGRLLSADEIIEILKSSERARYR